MQTQPEEISRDRLNRNHHKSFNLSLNIHWVYSQGPLKLLKITQKARHITVSLLRFSVGPEKQTVVSVWHLPFKLSIFKTYLMKKELSHDEIRAIVISHKGYKTFSELMFFRINKVVESLNKELGDSAPGFTSHTKEVVAGSSFDPTDILRNYRFRSNNAFIDEVIETASEKYEVRAMA